MSRLRFDPLPKEYESAWRVLDETLRSLREVLDRGFRWREQVSLVKEVTINSDNLPLSIDVGDMRPLSVMLLRATVQHTATGRVLSGCPVDWELRGGAIRIHAVTGLTASTNYDAVIAVTE